MNSSSEVKFLGFSFPHAVFCHIDVTTVSYLEKKGLLSYHFPNNLPPSLKLTEKQINKTWLREREKSVWMANSYLGTYMKAIISFPGVVLGGAQSQEASITMKTMLSHFGFSLVFMHFCKWGRLISEAFKSWLPLFILVNYKGCYTVIIALHMS